ncbi:hypothetical protein SAMN06265371_10630 [Lutibacter agarilyticus]|uniref:DUF2357 domain-containing protein n=1 Tax=Lutibacter agarilyticus TaxID=1109740 RepID=A0A238XHL0_9FLAO|nr:DUF2357 domain-containing protein [Lutibacter agarilyticus]SNR58061.1 hypothetical protein SAMN06265371_10630 [Lutibacter agarilyticus]
MTGKSSIIIPLDFIEQDLNLFIDDKRNETLFYAEDALRNNEAPFQIQEGNFYDYEFSSEDFYFQKTETIQPHRRKAYTGQIAPNIYVGTLTLEIYKKDIDKSVGTLKLEVQSIKSEYREDYRYMLESITEKCTDLILQSNSPVSHSFQTDYNIDSKTLYQRFAFIKSIIQSDDFEEAIHRIITSPTTIWKEKEEKVDVRKMKRFNANAVKQLVNGSNRVSLNSGHPLSRRGLTTVSDKINSTKKTENVDTNENRFIKHALNTFLKFCIDLQSHPKAGDRLKKEADLVINTLENHLQHSLFKEISRPETLKLNSPILQRKEGYREVLKVWLMFDLAAKLIWEGGEDIYSGGKKDIATLYEYWLFFTLLDIFQKKFEIEPKELEKLTNYNSKTKNLNLQLKQGRFTALKGVYISHSRALNVKFNYNRSFSGASVYPSAGSWTTTMRPDYTLSFWPKELKEKEAEQTEQIVHIHFDAKYKINKVDEIIGNRSGATEVELNEEKLAQKKGTYKNADLLKMHAYKDAIRRTGGAYVLYPGTEQTTKIGFHEILPGLGAFSVKPSKINVETSHVEAFIDKVIAHFVNRSTQRENLATKTYDIHNTAIINKLKQPIPEYLNNRKLIPDETFVLVGYYNSVEQYNWINTKKLYNFRMGSTAGSLILDKETVDAKFLLLHGRGDQHSNELWEIKSKGPKVYSKDNLISKGYINPSSDHYLVIEIEKVDLNNFGNQNWNFKKLKNYKKGRASSLPFTCSLTELMLNS